MSKSIPATIRFLRPSEGGRTTPAPDGVHALLQVGDVLTSCIIHSSDGSKVFVAERDYDVSIEMRFWDEYGSRLSADDGVALYDGNRLIARGTWRADSGK
jgi:hypothetical protein